MTRRTRRSLLRGLGTVGAGAVGLSAVGGATTRPGPEPVVLVHGYGDTGETPWWDVARGYFRDVGYPDDAIHVLNLGAIPGTTVDSPEEYATAVQAALESVSDEHGSAVDVVAHSMGGLDTRWCVEKLDGAQYVDDLVTLGTPHQGTYAAYLGSLTPGGRDMRPGSEFLTALNDGQLAEGVAYAALWSSADELIVPSRFAALPDPELSSVASARNRNTGLQEHVQLVFDRAVFDQYAPLLD
ncbi:lipase family alpha/beta hydrolase [Halomarina rubra]|uniref:Lipase family alpha/beta hydrolase n=1 Tax=Halomarina rubra TaxID=2071873 RepID=A0ABD6AYF4_9EURY|nr:alpha/beta fold hydrolase [Halomarina rubra]